MGRIPRRQAGRRPQAACTRFPTGPTLRRPRSSNAWANLHPDVRDRRARIMSMTISDRAARLLALDPPLSPPAFGEAAAMAPAAAEAVHDALSRGETHYTDRPGILPLREKVASLLNRRFGLSFDAGRITLTCGVTEARFVTVQQLLPSGGLVAAPL